MKLKVMIGAAVLLALPVQAATLPSKSVSCVTEPELRAGLAFAMQEVMVAVSSRCGPNLSETSYLRTKGPQLVARYADTASKETDVLNNLIKRLGPELKIADGDPVAMKGMVSTLIATGLGKVLSDKRCEDVDQALSLLDPMPAENMIGLFVFAAQKADLSDRTKAKRAGNAAPKRSIICAAGTATGTKDRNSLDRH
jgi:hypothetical protein